MDYTPIFLTEPSGEALLISSLLENYVIARPRRHYNETVDVVTSVTVTELIGLVSCGYRELKVCILEMFQSLKSILVVHFVDLFLLGFSLTGRLVDHRAVLISVVATFAYMEAWFFLWYFACICCHIYTHSDLVHALGVYAWHFQQNIPTFHVYTICLAAGFILVTFIVLLHGLLAITYVFCR